MQFENLSNNITMLGLLDEMERPDGEMEEKLLHKFHNMLIQHVN